jgi:hypothetical protein
MMMINVAKRVLLIALVVAVGYVAVLIIGNSRRGNRFDEIVRNMNKEQVTQLMGQPDEIRMCDRPATWLGDPSSTRCVWSSTFITFVSSRTVGGVDFNDQGRLVGKYVANSP